MPVYNALPYLEESVRAVQGQTLREWELLLVDDGSTDGSGALADSLAAGDERIRVLHQENAGVSVARNRGLDEARGKYIGFVDADDVPRPEMFRVLTDAAETAACDIVTACYASVSGGEIVFCAKPPFPPGRVFGRGDVHGWLVGMHQKRSFLFIWRRLFSASLIRENGLRFDPEIVFGEDSLFCLECFLCAERTLCIPDVLYLYRYAPDSAMRRRTYRPKLYASFEKLYRRKKEILLREFPDDPLPMLRELAAYTRGALLVQVLENLFVSPSAGYIAFRRLWRSEMLRDMLRYLDWTPERSRSLDSVMLRLLRVRMKLPAYFLARKIYRKGN